MKTNPEERAKMLDNAKKKLQLSSYLCGRQTNRFEKNLLVMEWHHVNEEDKIASIADMYKRERALHLAEYSKCILLCKRHHSTYHLRSSTKDKEELQKILSIHNTTGFIANIPYQKVHESSTLHTKHHLEKLSLEEYDIGVKEIADMFWNSED
jgi:hypothetical protein